MSERDFGLSLRGGLPDNQFHHLAGAIGRRIYTTNLETNERLAMINTAKASFFKSLSDELESQSHRVRQLIGSAHWGHDGRHKELILADLIRRHCPSSILVATGFVISPNNLDCRSLEQDILLIDTRFEAPLFYQGGLAIVFAHTVIAAISVKTQMHHETLKDSIKGLQSVREILRSGDVNQERLWAGVFFYAMHDEWCDRPDLVYENTKRYIMASPVSPPLIDDGLAHVGGPNYIGDSRNTAVIVRYQRTKEGHRVTMKAYSGESMGTAIFLSCLLEHIAVLNGNSHSSFSDLVEEVDFSASEAEHFILERFSD